MNTKRDKVLKRAINVLAHKMRTVKEMSDKLMEKCDDEEIVNDVLFELCQKKLLDDLNYATLYIQDSINLKQKGLFQISMELEEKGVDRNVINRAIEASEVDEFAAVLNYIEVYTRAKTFESYKDVEKLKAHLARRGYTFDVINLAVRELGI
ncbi:MAG: recombination regulator RecX [Oscillospiraceae bacterium]|nr:recombination regulator RecX [Oscillospiraceae bacterium]